MYHTGLDPRSMKKVYVAKSLHDKALQRALIHYNLPENRELVLEALKKAGRYDLIGRSPKCLIRDTAAPPIRDTKNSGRIKHEVRDKTVKRKR
jgi:hypothetical protein